MLIGVAHGRNPKCHLGREAVTAFGATASQYFAAVLGGHARAETVGALAAKVAGLKCTLHGTTPCNRPVWAIDWIWSPDTGPATSKDRAN